MVNEYLAKEICKFFFLLFFTLSLPGERLSVRGMLLMLSECALTFCLISTRND